MRRFELAERELRPGCTEVRVGGELDLAVASRLEELLEGVAGRANEVLIDLGSCEFIDSSGIAVILRAHRKMTEEGKRLAVFGPSAQVLRVLSMTGLTANGLVYDNAEDALAGGSAAAG